VLVIIFDRTLLSTLDHCVTPFGRRLLREWLARPLLLKESIKQRQMAVKDLKVSCRSLPSLKIRVLLSPLLCSLMSIIWTLALIPIALCQGVALDAVSRFKKEMARVPDLERALARLHASR
jgi:DNA mismatch repair ATPase MutS